VRLTIAILSILALLATSAEAARPHRRLPLPQMPPPAELPMPPAVLKVEPRAQYDHQQKATEYQSSTQVPPVVKVIPPEKTEEEKKRERQKDKIDRRIADYTERLFQATFGLMIATGALAAVAFFQMREARESIEATKTLASAAVDHAGHADRAASIMSDTAKRQLRAYILGNGGSIQITGTSGHSFPRHDPRPPADIEITATFVIKNFGMTPAYEFTVWRAVNLWSAKAPQYGEIGETIGKDIVGPGTEVSIVARLILTPDDYVAVKSGAKEIYSWGRADYIDAFKEKRYFRFYQVNGREHPTEQGWFLEPADKPQEAN
jgi:hypothetical protein